MKTTHLVHHAAPGPLSGGAYYSRKTFCGIDRYDVPTVLLRSAHLHVVGHDMPVCPRCLDLAQKLPAGRHLAHVIADRAAGVDYPPAT